MSNAPLDPELINIYEAVEAALFKVHHAQSDNNNPEKTKEDTDRHLTEASNHLARVKKDIVNHYVDINASEAVDYVVSEVHRLPRSHPALNRAPNVHTPDWPLFREVYVVQVKTRLAPFVVQLDGGRVDTPDPRLFQTQARREASMVIFGMTFLEQLRR